MRKGKTEEIRRLLAAAAGMCEHGSLNEVRRQVLAAMQGLAQVEEKESKKKKTNVHEKTMANYPNPKLTLKVIDEMIGRELDKKSRPFDGH